MGHAAFFGVITAATVIAFYFFMWWREGPRIEKVREMLKNGALLIDVDDPQEFALDPIEGATNIPSQELARRAHEIGPLEHSIVVCGRRKLRTARAAQELRGIGFHEVLNVGHRHW